MAKGITIAIKGDISDLESEINKAEQLIVSTQKEIAKGENTLASARGNHKKKIDEYKNALKTLIATQKNSSETYKEQRAEIVALKASHQDILKISMLEINSIQQAVAGNKERIHSQQSVISGNNQEIQNKKKLIAIDALYIKQALDVIDAKRIEQKESIEALKKDIILRNERQIAIEKEIAKEKELIATLKKEQQMATSKQIDKDKSLTREKELNDLKESIILRNKEQEEISQTIQKEKELATVLKQRYKEKYTMTSGEVNFKRQTAELKAMYQAGVIGAEAYRAEVQRLNPKLIEATKIENEKQKELEQTIQKEKELATVLKQRYKEKYTMTSGEVNFKRQTAELKAMYQAGVIGAEQYRTQVQKLNTELKQKELQQGKVAKATDSLTNSVVRHLRQIETLVIAYYTLRTGWENTIGIGIEVNKIIESNTMGIAALTSANTRMVDSLGNTLTPFEKFAMGQKVATKAVEGLRVASVKTYATFPQLLEIYQQAIGQTMSMGGAFGETVDDVSKNTIELSKTLSNIAGSIGMPMDRVREEIRSMLSGNASTDSLISTMLFGSPGEANKAIRDAKGRTNGVVDLLNNMVKDFKILETTRTYQKGILTLQDSWSRAMAEMVQKSGMFKDITDMFYSMSKNIVDNTDNIIGTFDSLYNTAKFLEVPFDNLVSVGSILAEGILKISGEVEGLQNTVRGDNALGLFSSSMLGLSVILDTVYVGLHNSITILSKLKPTGNVFTDILQATKIDLGELNKEIISFDSFEDRLVKTYEKIANIQKEGNARTSGVSVNRITSKIDTSSLNQQGLKTIYEGLLDTYKDYEDKKLYLAKWYKEETYKIDPNLEYEEFLKKKFASDKDYYEALEKLNAKTRVNFATRVGERQASLLLKLGVDQKTLDAMKKRTELAEDKLVKLQDQRVKSSKDLSTWQKKYNEESIKNTLDEEGKKILLNAIKNAKADIASTDKQISEEEQKREEKKQNILRKQEKIIQDNIAASKMLAGEETKKSDELYIQIEAISKRMEKEKDEYKLKELDTALMLKTIEYNKEITDEKQKQITLSKEEALLKEKIKAIASIDLAKIAENPEIKAMEELRDLETDQAKKKELTNQILAKRIATVLQVMEAEKALAGVKGDTEEVAKYDLAIAKINAIGTATEEVTNKTATLVDELRKLEELKVDIRITGFDDISNGIAEAINGFTELNNAQVDYAKEVKKSGKNSVESKKAEMKMFDSQIGMYADMSGAIGSFYDEDDDRKKKQAEVTKALNMVQMAAQIATMAQSTAFTGLFVAQETVKQQAAGATAVAIAAQSSPWTGFATAAAMIAMLASIGVALSGSGGGSNTGMSAVEVKKEAFKTTNDLIIGRLDRQIELLEALNRGGTALISKAQGASAQYASDIGNVSYAVAQDRVLADKTEQIRKDVLASIINGFKDYATSHGSSATIGKVPYAGNVAYNVLLDTSSLAGNLQSTALYIQYLNDNLENIRFDLIDRFSREEAVSYINDTEQAITDYATTMIDIVFTLKDAASSFADIYDSLSRTDTYKLINLENAQNDVNDLLGVGETLADYVSAQAQAINEVNKQLDGNIIDLLLSEDISRIAEKAQALDLLSKATQNAFNGGIKEAVNYIDSIKLVADAMANSADNVKSWNDSFKTDAELVRESMISLGFDGVAKSMSELDLIFKELSKGVEGLTDSELELLDANKTLVEENKKLIDDMVSGFADSMQSTADSLRSTIENLRNQNETGTQSLEKFYSAMSEAKSLSSGGSYTDFEDAVAKAIVASSVLQDASNFQTERDMQFAQLVAANQFESLETITLKEVDYLKMIVENTNSLKEADTVYGFGDSRPTSVTGFSTGGYTGNISTTSIAGVVHGGEFVIDARNTAQLGLNQNMGSTFNNMVVELRNIKAENKELRASIDKLIHISNRQLSTQEATFVETTKVYQAVSA